MIHAVKKEKKQVQKFHHRELNSGRLDYGATLRYAPHNNNNIYSPAYSLVQYNTEKPSPCNHLWWGRGEGLRLRVEW